MCDNKTSTLFLLFSFLSSNLFSKLAETSTTFGNIPRNGIL